MSAEKFDAKLLNRVGYVLSDALSDLGAELLNTGIGEKNTLMPQEQIAEIDNVGRVMRACFARQDRQ
jgi:hypothetical protein